MYVAHHISHLQSKSEFVEVKFIKFFCLLALIVNGSQTALSEQDDLSKSNVGIWYFPTISQHSFSLSVFEIFRVQCAVNYNSTGTLDQRIHRRGWVIMQYLIILIPPCSLCCEFGQEMWIWRISFGHTEPSLLKPWSMQTLYEYMSHCFDSGSMLTDGVTDDLSFLW